VRVRKSKPKEMKKADGHRMEWIAFGCSKYRFLLRRNDSDADLFCSNSGKA